MKSFRLNTVNAFIRYQDIPGNGPALVFLHGLGTSAFVDFTETVIDSRFRAFHCLIIEFLGFGFSDKPQSFGYSLYDHAGTIAELLDSLDIRSAIIAGHSMGGTVAIALTQKRPDLVSRLIIIEPNLDPGVGTVSKAIASQSEGDFLETGYDKYVRALRMSAYKDIGDAGYLGTFTLADPAALHRSAVGLLAGTSPPQREIISTMNIPKIYMVGEQNINDIPPVELQALGLSTLVVPNAGHAMMHENLDGFRDALIQAINNS
jgi:pimeloyl-ACP methyl ester carboxylesterase